MKLQNLKRGMKCTRRNGSVGIIDVVNSESGTIKYISDVVGAGVIQIFDNDDLTFDNAPELDVIKIEDITTVGYQTIWERQEVKYYLRLPEEYHRGAVLNYVIKDDRFMFGDTDEVDGHYKTQFTQCEIEKLPKYELVNALEKVLVGGEQ